MDNESFPRIKFDECSELVHASLSVTVKIIAEHDYTLTGVFTEMVEVNKVGVATTLTALLGVVTYYTP